MIEHYINQASHSFDNVFCGDTWVHFFDINGYPVIGILWNFFLLIFPFLFCLALVRYYRKTGFKSAGEKLAALGLGILWLFLIPNAAYIMTDVRHLSGFCPPAPCDYVCVENTWMIIFFFTYSFLGWALFVFLINQMRDFIALAWSRKAGGVFAWLIIPLISLGVLLGLVNRWNSWEIFIAPGKILESALVYFTQFSYFKNWLIFTGCFYLLYFGGNFILKRGNK